MSYWIKRKFDRRRVGTEVPNLPESIAQSLLKRGILTDKDPNSKEEFLEVEAEQIVKPAQRGRKPNKK